MEIRDESVAPSSGLLNQRLSMEHFDLLRLAPPPELADHVENFWGVIWDLSEQPDYTQHNLPHPSANLVIDPHGGSGLFGVQSGRWTYTLSGRGAAFAAKFHPGSLRASFGRSMQDLTDTRVPAQDLLGVADGDLEERLAVLNDPAQMREVLASLLIDRVQPVSSDGQLARRLCEHVRDQHEVMRVAALAKSAGLSVRALQRLFAEEIGVSPKWVIDRYRMLEAVDALNRGDRLSLTDLAHRLDYHDSAHFTHAFRALTGVAPSAYRAAAG